MTITFDTAYALQQKKQEFETAGHKCSIVRGKKHVLKVRINPNGDEFIPTGDGWKKI